MDYYKLKLLFIVLTSKLCAAQNLNNLSYEIKSLYGQPDYRSVNLTFEVEDKNENRIVTDDEVRKFVIYYCEIQSWGEMHRCKSKVLEDNERKFKKNSIKEYKTIIKNLRMATKYSFNVRPQKAGEAEKSARSESFSKDDMVGQNIVIPTKGFSAIATKCLPNESEIMIETGPNFGGRITSENGECGIDGNAKDSRESYVLRIDHEKCGSQVSHDDLTVETYITVQENSGILTHSTRRFLVVCTFQPDTLTVRARLALPSKGESSVMDQEAWPERERGARTRQFKMVDKSALILKESTEHSMENAIGDIENLTEKILSQEKSQFTTNTIAGKRRNEPLKNARYLRYSSESGNSLPINSLVGVTIGFALTVLIIFVFLYVFKRSRNNQEHLEKLQTTAVY